MNLYEIEEQRKQKEKNKKMTRYIVISIVIIVVLIVALMCAIYFLVNNPNRIRVYLDGKETPKIAELLITETKEDGTSSIYAPIRDIASYLNYESSNGAYTTASEDPDSCYIKNKNEIAIFNLNSNIIYKLDRTADNADYEYVKIENKVIKKDNKLYVEQEGLEKSFNISFKYNEKEKKIQIYTLDYYVGEAQKKIKKLGYQETELSFANQKALLDNMLVALSSDDQYCVINFSTGAEILGKQYDEITYIPQKSAFLVEYNNKVGIISSDGSTKIKANYDRLTLIDDENELYLAQLNGLYGVIDINEKNVIYIEYDKIGIDITDFKENEVKSGYILLNKLIPVQQNNKWGFFDITGKQITNLEYDKIGCITSTSKNVAYNLLVIPDYNVIAVGKNNRYTFMDLQGKEVFACVFEDLYMELQSGKLMYYMVGKDNDGETDRTGEVTQYLEKIGITKDSKEE